MTRRDKRRPNARRIAYNVLHEVGSSGAYANLGLSRALRSTEMDARDARLATDLVGGVLRNRTLLDAVLSEAVDRDLARLDPRLLDVLRMGAYQWVLGGRPAHACVTTSVDLAADVVGTGPGRLVNAVLRRVVSTPAEGLLGSRADPVVRWSHPAWIIAAFRDALGPGRAGDLEALLEVNNTSPAVTLVARPGLCKRAELEALGGTTGRWSPYAVRAPKGDVGLIAAVRDGRAAVQDEGSQLAALALAAAPIEGRDEVWLDLCAGPGGKAALLAAMAVQRGARVVAVEIRPHRARLVASALRLSSASAVAVLADGRQPPVGAVDRVLVDVPCTGLGVIRRRPDLRWRRSPRDVQRLAGIQADLLEAGIAAVRPGGVVAYVTCSPHVAETEMVLRSVMDRDRLELIDARGLMPGVSDVGPGPAARLWPHLHDTDGMYVALMRRTA